MRQMTRLLVYVEPKLPVDGFHASSPSYVKQPCGRLPPVLSVRSGRLQLGHAAMPLSSHSLCDETKSPAPQPENAPSLQVTSP